eukprot:s245_g8.t1
MVPTAGHESEKTETRFPDQCAPCWAAVALCGNTQELHQGQPTCIELAWLMLWAWPGRDRQPLDSVLVSLFHVPSGEPDFCSKGRLKKNAVARTNLGSAYFERGDEDAALHWCLSDYISIKQSEREGKASAWTEQMKGLGYAGSSSNPLKRGVEGCCPGTSDAHAKLVEDNEDKDKAGEHDGWYGTSAFP